MSELEEKQEKRGPESSIPIRVTDRRPRFEGGPAEEATAEHASAERRYPSFVAELQDRVRAAETNLAQALDLLRRRESEAEEFRTRLRREMERRSRGEVETFLRAFLEVVDSLDRGVAAAQMETDPPAMRTGLILVRDQFFSALAREGVEPMKLVGTEYDPHLAEAVATSPAGTEEDDNKIVEEVRRGFTFRGQVLRPAQVRVARRAAPVTPGEGAETPSGQS